MADLLKTGSDWLCEQLKSHGSSAVVYKRGASTVTVQAQRGSSEAERNDTSGLVVEIEQRDYLILAADLVLGGVAVEPQRGDKIEDTDASGVTRVFEVLPLMQGEPCWRWSDSYFKKFRIHAKQIDVELPS